MTAMAGILCIGAEVEDFAYIILCILLKFLPLLCFSILTLLINSRMISCLFKGVIRKI